MGKKFSILAVTALMGLPLFGDSVERLELMLRHQMKIIQNLQKEVEALKAKEAENRQLKAELEQLKRQLEQAKRKPTTPATSKEIAQLKQKVEKAEKLALENRKRLNPITANDHIYWSYDLRSAFDFIQYQTNANNAKKKRFTNNVLTNRVRLTGVAKPSDNLKATLQLEAYNIYGMNMEHMYSPFQNISWVASETPDDTVLRVKQAFFNYHFGPNNGLMFSAGRRPATEGFPANLREGDNPSSPLAHLINMEFDGVSFEIGNDFLSELSDTFSDWGSWLKFCAGRGYSSSLGAFPTATVDVNGAQIPAPPYSRDDLAINDFAGFILVPYDDGTYALWNETIYAWNVKGNICNASGCQMRDLGDVFGTNFLFKITGI
ncbi:MAG: DUF3373 family protein, partial [Campylobacterales bacterium]